MLVMKKIIDKRRYEMKHRISLAVSLFAVLCVIAIAGAGSAQAAVEKWELGGGVGIAPDYEGSSNYDAVPIPYASVYFDNDMNVILAGAKVRATLLRFDNISAGPVLNFRRGRDDDVENDRVSDLSQIDDAVELGAFGKIDIDKWNVKLEILTDISDEHKGTLFTLGGGYTWIMNETMILLPSISTTYATTDYMNTYFSITRRDSVRSGLDEFDADSGFKDFSLKVGYMYQMTEKWSLKALASYTLLLDDASDSPVVDDVGDENQYFGGFAFVYTFGEGKKKDMDMEPYRF
jgi:outer membrane protein